MNVLDLEAAEALLKVYYGSQQDARNHLFLLCIDIACSGTLDWTECTSLLDFAISQRADIDACFPSGRAIDMLIQRRQDKLLHRWLLWKRPDMGQITLGSRSLYPIYDIIKNGPSRTVPIQALLSRGRDPRFVKMGTGHTALHLAITMQLSKDVRTLLEHQASPMALDQTDTSAFHTAVRCGHLPIIKDILPFVGDKDVLGALEIASSLDLTEGFKLLLGHN